MLKNGGQCPNAGAAPHCPFVLTAVAAPTSLSHWHISWPSSNNNQCTATQWQQPRLQHTQ